MTRQFGDVANRETSGRENDQDPERIPKPAYRTGARAKWAAQPLCCGNEQRIGLTWGDDRINNPGFIHSHIVPYSLPLRHR
jgi:hypothetical protein